MKVDGLTNDEVKSHLQVTYITSHHNMLTCLINFLLIIIKYFMLINRNIGFTLEDQAQAHKHQVDKVLI